MVLKDSGSCFFGFESWSFGKRNGPLQVDKLSCLLTSHPTPGQRRAGAGGCCSAMCGKTMPFSKWKFCHWAILSVIYHWEQMSFKMNSTVFWKKHVFGKCFYLSVLGRLIIYPLGILCAMKLSLCSLHRVQRYPQAEDSLTSWQNIKRLGLRGSCLQLEVRPSTWKSSNFPIHIFH